MARLSGSWNKFGFDQNAWDMVIEDKPYLTVKANRIRLSGSVSLSGGLVLTDDLSSVGGYAQSFMFVQNNLEQGQFAAMTSSIVSATASVDVPKVWTSVPMVRAGSVLGLTLYTDTIIKSGSLSASVTINNVNCSASLAGHTGSTLTMTPIAKDLATFTAGQRIGVSLSASSLYLSEPDITSASFIATVLVEM
jgi:hypothetical protein